MSIATPFLNIFPYRARWSTVVVLDMIVVPTLANPLLSSFCSILVVGFHPSSNSLYPTSGSFIFIFIRVVYSLYIPSLTATTHNALAVIAMVGIMKTFSASTLGCRLESSHEFRGNLELLGSNRETRVLMLYSARGCTNVTLSGPPTYNHTYPFAPALHLYCRRPKNLSG